MSIMLLVIVVVLAYLARRWHQKNASAENPFFDCFVATALGERNDLIEEKMMQAADSVAENIIVAMALDARDELVEEGKVESFDSVTDTEEIGKSTEDAEDAATGDATTGDAAIEGGKQT